MESHKNIEWVISRGLVPYNESIELMENILSRVIEGQNDHIILTEHPKIITAGTSADIADIMDGLDIEIIETKRGGKHTFHGPGQRVIYPIINIEESEKAYIKNISDTYEQTQIICIDLAKQFALNTDLFNNYYHEYYNKSKEFCEEFHIPIKIKST